MANQIHGKNLIPVRYGCNSSIILALRGDGTTRLFEAHPLVDRFNEEHRTQLRVVPHSVSDIIVNFASWRSRIDLPAFATDTMIAYEKPGTPLGKEIVFSVDGELKVVFATGKFEGEKDIALVALRVFSRDFKKDGNSLVLDVGEPRLIAVPNFPSSSGTYALHPKTGIPYGANISPSSFSWQDHVYTTRYFQRSPGSYVGLLTRCSAPFGQGAIAAGILSSDKLGVVVEVHTADVTKIRSLLPDPRAPGTLLGDAIASLAGLGQTVRPERLEAIRKLLDAIGVADIGVD